MNPTEPNVPAIRQRRPMTEARLKANRENAKKAALSGRFGRPRGSIDGNRLSLRERCRVRDEEHVRILEAIAADSTHPGFQLVAIRDLMDRGHDAGSIFIPVEAVERLARAISAMVLLSLLSGLEGNSTVKGRPHLLTDDMLGRWRIPSNQRRRGFSELASRGVVTYAQQGKDFLSRISV